MKKTLIGLLALLMVGGFVALAQAQPAPGESVNVTVRVSITSALEITVVSGWEIVFVTAMAPGAGATVNTSSTTIRNTGSGIAQTYKMYAISPSTWTAGATADHNVYVLQALFNDTQPTSGNFGAEDTLGEGSGNEIIASDTILAIDENYTGASVAYDAERSIWYSFQPPETSTLTGTLDITVTITAIESL